MASRVCVTCGAKAGTMVEFPCPECDERIVRCEHCRRVNNPYKCKCGFVGP